MARLPSKLPPSLFEHTPWEGIKQSIWPASTFTIRRNLSKQLFPQKMNQMELSQTLEFLKNAIFQTLGLPNMQLFKAEELDTLDKEFLFEHYLEMEGFENLHAGQGFIIDDSGFFLAILNMNDHLQLQFIDNKSEWKNAWDNLLKLEAALASALEFAFSERFGYLTADLTSCGTAVTIKALLHLPALIQMGQLKEILTKEKTEEVEVVGMEGNLENIIGDLVIVRNRFSIGIDEETLLKSIYTLSTKLMLAEKALREHLSEKETEMKDKISRAFGLLFHSYQLQTKEALSTLSLFKLGLQLGWISGISDQKIDELFFKCRRAHLLLSLPPDIDPKDLSHKRAEFIHSQLKDAKLTI